MAYYQDEDGELIDKGKAARVEIVEFDSDDKVIWRTYGEMEQQDLQ